MKTGMVRPKFFRAVRYVSLSEKVEYQGHVSTSYDMMFGIIGLLWK